MLTAEEIIKYLIELVQLNLEELEAAIDENNLFLYGEKIAYIECLEVLQKWEHAADFGLDYDIEKRFPVR